MPVKISNIVSELYTRNTRNGRQKIPKIRDSGVSSAYLNYCLCTYQDEKRKLRSTLGFCHFSSSSFYRRLPPSWVFSLSRMDQERQLRRRKRVMRLRKDAECRLIRSLRDITIPSSDGDSSLDSEEMSVTNNSLSKNYLHPDDHAKRITDTPGLKPFTR